VKACSDLDLRTEVTTNGVLLSHCKLQDMADAKLTYLRISDYGSARTPDSVYALLTEFRVWRDAHNLGPRIVVKTFSAARLDVIRLAFPSAADDWAREDKLHNWAGRVGTGTADTTRRVCPSPFYMVQIKANGDVMPCCACAFHNRLGNIHEQPFAEIWHGKTAQDFRRMQIAGGRFENEGCKNCSYPALLPDNLDALEELLWHFTSR
jgi:radical SAM protein with 4Fe4S-binding SPASM domain